MRETLRVLSLVVEGYAYIALVVATLIGVPVLLVMGLFSRRPFVALVAILIGVPALLVVRTAVRALFFRVPPPDGASVTETEAPAFHAEVVRIARAVGAPTVHEVVLVGNFNASAVQLPRFGVFWPRNYLLIGFPLFAVLSPDQMRAVIAHELAHLSGEHGRLALLVYRLRLSWTRLVHALDGATPTFALVLLRWYAPRLQRHSQALSRHHEIVVDRLAAQVAGTEAAADTLVALGVIGPIYQDALWDAVARDERDTPGPFSRAQPDVWTLAAAEGETRLATLLSRTTESSDTHPALAERLARLGATPRLPTPPDRTASDAWLGSLTSVVAARLDEQWAAGRGKDWAGTRRARREGRERLQVLEGISTLTPTELDEKARIVELLNGASAALPLYEQAAEAGHAGAALAAGRLLLERDDDRGIALIEQAVARDASLGEDGNDNIANFLQSRGRFVEANRYATLAQAAATRATLANAERRDVSPVDRFTVHDLDQSSLDRVIASLSRSREIHGALLVRKELRYSTGTQLVLAVEANGAPPSLRDRLVAERVVPDESVILMLGRMDAPLRQALDAVPGARIYQRA